MFVTFYKCYLITENGMLKPWYGDGTRMYQRNKVYVFAHDECTDVDSMGAYCGCSSLLSAMFYVGRRTDCVLCKCSGELLETEEEDWTKAMSMGEKEWLLHLNRDILGVDKKDGPYSDEFHFLSQKITDVFPQATLVGYRKSLASLKSFIRKRLPDPTPKITTPPTDLMLEGMSFSDWVKWEENHPSYSLCLADIFKKEGLDWVSEENELVIRKVDRK